MEGQQLPARGAQVHAEYLLHGHFQTLRRLLGPGARHLVFCLDEDPGLPNACLAAFGQRVRDGSTEIVRIQVDKKLTLDDRRRALAEARRAFEAEKGRFPGLDDRAVGEALIVEAVAVAVARAAGPLPSRRLQGGWLPNPVPDPAEPRKRWRFVTDTDRLPDRAVARMLRRSSLWPIDRTFNMLRRRVAMFERPVASVRRARRSWHIYARCDPGMVNRTLEIFRVWHNWLWRSPKDGRTAAERLGPAQGEVRIDHVIGFDMREAAERLWGAG